MFHTKSFPLWVSRLLILVALPLVMITNIYAYARQQKSWPAQLASFIVFVPVIAITSMIWFGASGVAVGIMLALLKK